MLTINIVCVGKLKEKFFKDAVSEYSKRLSKYCKLNILELPDEKIPNNSNETIFNEIKAKECKNISSHLKENSYVACLDLRGKEYSSEQFATKIESLKMKTSSITFVIGGSLGLTKEFLINCDEQICFSKMTFPHQLMRIFLLEQLFRAFKISNGETYHR